MKPFSHQVEEESLPPCINQLENALEHSGASFHRGALYGAFSSPLGDIMYLGTGALASSRGKLVYL